MAEFKLDELKSYVRRLDRLIGAAEKSPDSWDRSVSMGEIRLMAINLFELSQGQIKSDDPHNVGGRSLAAYMLEAYARWDSDTAAERAHQRAEDDRRLKEQLMTPEEWKHYKESDEFKRSRGQQ